MLIVSFSLIFFHAYFLKQGSGVIPFLEVRAISAAFSPLFLTGVSYVGHISAWLAEASLPSPWHKLLLLLSCSWPIHFRLSHYLLLPLPLPAWGSRLPLSFSVKVYYWNQWECCHWLQKEQNQAVTEEWALENCRYNICLWSLVHQCIALVLHQR